MVTSEQLAEKMKAEILSDVRVGRVPAAVKTFAELHDYVDANCYGGTEELLDELSEGATTDDQHAAAFNIVIDLMGVAMDRIDRWIKMGGIFDVVQKERLDELAACRLRYLADRRDLPPRRLVRHDPSPVGGP